MNILNEIYRELIQFPPKDDLEIVFSSEGLTKAKAANDANFIFSMGEKQLVFGLPFSEDKCQSEDYKIRKRS